MTAWDVGQARLLLTAPHRELPCDWSVVPESCHVFRSLRGGGELVEWNGVQSLDLTGKSLAVRHSRRSHLRPPAPDLQHLEGQNLARSRCGTLPCRQSVARWSGCPAAAALSILLLALHSNIFRSPTRPARWAGADLPGDANFSVRLSPGASDWKCCRAGHPAGVSPAGGTSSTTPSCGPRID